MAINRQHKRRPFTPTAFRLTIKNLPYCPPVQSSICFNRGTAERDLSKMLKVPGFGLLTPPATSTAQGHMTVSLVPGPRAALPPASHFLLRLGCCSSSHTSLRHLPTQGPAKHHSAHGKQPRSWQPPGSRPPLCSLLSPLPSCLRNPGEALGSLCCVWAPRCRPSLGQGPCIACHISPSPGNSMSPWAKVGVTLVLCGFQVSPDPRGHHGLYL